VWCSSEVFKPYTKDCRIEVKSLLVKHVPGARVVPLRTHHQFEIWLADHGQSPMLLLCDWKSAKPCLDALHFAKASLSSLRSSSLGSSSSNSSPTINNSSWSNSNGNNSSSSNNFSSLSLERSLVFGIYVLADDPNIVARASAWAASLEPEIIVHVISDVNAIDFSTFQSLLVDNNNNSNKTTSTTLTTLPSTGSLFSENYAESESGSDEQGNNNNIDGYGSGSYEKGNNNNNNNSIENGKAKSIRACAAGLQGSSPSYVYGCGSTTTTATLTTTTQPQPQQQATLTTTPTAQHHQQHQQEQQQLNNKSKSKSNKIQTKEQLLDLDTVPCLRQFHEQLQ
ncbi:unnamed protein product, partial [Polarella glacialis]